MEKELERLKLENEELKQTIEDLKFCHRYQTTRKSYFHAMKFIQFAELWIYRILKPLKLFICHKQPKESIPTSITKTPIQKVAVFIHAYYPDLLQEIGKKLENIPVPYDLYLNIPEGVEEIIPSDLQIKKLYRLKNIGKDIGSFIHFLKDADLSPYQAVLKLHTKKSVRMKVREGEIWRRALLRSLIGSTERVSEILNELSNDSTGMIGTEELYLQYNIREENMKNFSKLLSMLNVKNKNFNYHAGSMFWIKPKALKRIIENPQLNFELFLDSKNQDDGDIEHAFERIFALTTQAEKLSVKNFSASLQ